MTRVTLTFSQTLSQAEGEQLQQLFSDAFGEFVQQREPTQTYVLRRYEGQSNAFKLRKIYEVTKRKMLALKVKLAAADLRFEHVRFVDVHP